MMLINFEYCLLNFFFWLKFLKLEGRVVDSQQYDDDDDTMQCNLQVFVEKHQGKKTARKKV